MNASDLVICNREQVKLDEVFLSVLNRAAIYQLIKEHYYIDVLQQYGLPVNNKLMLHGDSGCGKTITAKAIANALGRSLLVLNLSSIVCARIGETAQNLKMVFEKASRERAVLFLDEFDQVGKARGSDDREVGEMRRLVNTLIQLIDYYPGNSLLIAATNHKHIIDHALLRRFQVTITFDRPSDAELDHYYDQLSADLPMNLRSFQRDYKISYAEAGDSALTQVKATLIHRLEDAGNKLVIP